MRFAKFFAVLVTIFCEGLQFPSRILDTGQIDVCGAIPFRVHARMTGVDLVLNYNCFIC